MKNILLIISLLTVSLYADLSVKQIENMVTKIHEKRAGFDLETLEMTKNPFIITLEEEREELPTLVVPKEKTKGNISLHAIMGGKAFINNGWRDINDTVLGYRLKYIGKRGVVLRNGNQIKKLFLHENKNDFIKIEER